MLTQSLIQSLLLATMESFSKTKCCSYLRESLRFDTSTLESRLRRQHSRLTDVIQAAQQTEMYQQSRSLNGTSQTEKTAADLLLQQFQPTSKSDIRRHYPRGILSRKPERDWRYLSTSGTTDRLSVVADFVKRDHRRSSELRGLSIAVGAFLALKTVEIPPNVCNVVCGIDNSDTLPFKQLLWKGMQQRTLFQEKTLSDVRGRIERDFLLKKRTLLPIDPAPAKMLQNTLDDRLKSIQEHHPKILRGYPHYLLWLADRARQTRCVFPSLTHILPYGGLASPRMIERIESGFKSRFRNVYGTSELGLIAAGCGRSPGMHLFEDLFLVEVEPSTQRTVGNLLVTDLINTVMPMLRYRVGDVGALLGDGCPCGRKTSRLDVLGRSQESLSTDGKLITTSEIADTFFVDSRISNGRVDEVAPGCFEVDIVGTPEESSPDLQAWESRFRQLFDAPVKRVRTRIVPFLQPESSGKYLMVWPHQTAGRRN